MNRVPLVMRQVRSRASALNIVRHESYQASIASQPPLSVPYKGAPKDSGEGPYSPLPEKFKQLQQFYQTDTGKPIWRKNPFDEFMYRFLIGGTILTTLYSIYWLYIVVNPKKIAK